MTRVQKCQYIGWSVIGMVAGCSAVIFTLVACQ